MDDRWRIPPEGRLARGYRRAREAEDRRPIGRYGPAGFGFQGGYRGAYAERPGYAAPRGRVSPPRPEGSGWPRPVHIVDPAAEERHLRALADRDLARAVLAALYQTLGRAVDRLAVRARDGIITLEGAVTSLDHGSAALETAWNVQGVRMVRNRLGLSQRLRRY